MSSIDTQVGGDHYCQGKIQPVEYIEANGLGFLEGCVVKRATRHNRPGGKGRQDIEKAIHELQLLLELRYGADGHSEAPAPGVTEGEWVSGKDKQPVIGWAIEVRSPTKPPYKCVAAIGGVSYSQEWRYV